MMCMSQDLLERAVSDDTMGMCATRAPPRTVSSARRRRKCTRSPSAWVVKASKRPGTKEKFGKRESVGSWGRFCRKFCNIGIFVTYYDRGCTFVYNLRVKQQAINNHPDNWVPPIWEFNRFPNTWIQCRVVKAKEIDREEDEKRRW